MCGCALQQHFSTKDRKNDSGKVESTIVQSLINLCTKWLITTHQKVDFTISDFQCVLAQLVNTEDVSMSWLLCSVLTGKF
jgi:hypothetical protein